LLVKKHGYRQRVMFAEEVIHVEWYSS